jgi:hypothetical protein
MATESSTCAETLNPTMYTDVPERCLIVLHATKHTTQYRNKHKDRIKITGPQQLVNESEETWQRMAHL